MNPFQQFAYTSPSRKRGPYSIPPPKLRKSSPQLDVDVLEHILSFVLQNDSWRTLCASMHVSRSFSAAVYRLMIRHFGFEKEQAIAFIEAALLGHNVFITGGPGTGKSYVTECITRVLCKLNIKTCVTASTGLAASNVGGITTTRFIGARRVMQPKRVQLRVVCEDEYLHAQVDPDVDVDDEIETKTSAFMPVEGKQMFDKKLKTLIIDEVSMISDFKFQQLEHVVGHVMGTDNPFATAVQLIFVGDFAQLPAIIPSGTPEATAVNIGQFQRFLFKSKRWSGLKLHTIELTVCKRSQHIEYAKLACKLRDNMPVDVASWNAITRTEDANENLAIFGNFTPRGSTRQEKDRFPCASNFNRQRLSRLPGNWIKLKADDEQVSDIPVPKSLPNDIWIKNGCRIQLRNTMFNNSVVGISNNMCGTVQEAHSSCIIAQFFTDNHTSFRYDIHKTKVYSKTTAPLFGMRSSRSQFSIRVAHGITAHGAQGQTIHEPFVVQCDQCWDSGHLLVMLSRASDPNLMRLLNLDRARPFIAPAVLKFHQQIRTAMRQKHGRLWYVT